MREYPKDLDTPCLIVNRKVMQANITRMAEYCKRHGLRLRPHIKTHKVSEIAKLQIEAGAIGITVAKISEAEVMLAAGITQIHVAYPIVGRPKATRLARLVSQGAHVTVTIDGIESARDLSEAAQREQVKLGVLFDLDVGFGRTGFANLESLLHSAREVKTLPCLSIEGVFCFPGHVLQTPKNQTTAMNQIEKSLSTAIRALKSVGVSTHIVSSGSTPTAYQSHLSPSVNEIRPGTYVFNDSNSTSIEVSRLEDCALTVLTTVVSDAISGQIIVDGGSKTFSSDSCSITGASHRDGYGTVVDYPDAIFKRMSEEHGWIDVQSCRLKPRIGEKLRIIPNHVCPTVNLHDRIWIEEDGLITGAWWVSARGCLQ